MSKYTEVREVLKRLVDRGFTIHQVLVDEDHEEHDGDNIHEKNGVITPEAAYTRINEYDEASVYVTKNEKTYWLFFVLGNEPGVALSDYTVNDDIEEVSTEVYELYNQPDAGDKAVELQLELEKCKKKILEETVCFDETTDLFQMICILISQRDNAYNDVEHYKKQVKKYEKVV